MPKKSKNTELALPAAVIERRIYVIRGERIMLDSDLAELYEVTTKAFNQAVKRNADRFPGDFMKHLTAKEVAILRSQNVTSSANWGGRRYLPYAFTREGIAMLSSVLNSPRAVQVNIAIMRTFVQMRNAAMTQDDMLRKVTKLERKFDHNFRIVFEAIKKLMEPAPVKPRVRMGFPKPD